MAGNTRQTGVNSHRVLRPRTLVIAVMLLAAGVVARKAWESLHTQLVASPRYQITAEMIHLTPKGLPPWIRTDVKGQVLRDSGVTNSLSLLDKPAAIQQRLVDAFELHPWVRNVAQVDLASPQKIDVVLEYREPVAVAEVTAAGNTELLTVDADSVRLPDGDLTDVEKSYLPRITTIGDRPLVGEAWDDARMQGAAQLAARLREVWEPFSLMDIVPSAYPEVRRSHRYYVYELHGSGGTVVRWGTAPGFSPPGENSFDEKLALLSNFIHQNGPLDSIDTPASIEVRSTLQVEERLAAEDDSDDLVR